MYGLEEIVEMNLPKPRPVYVPVGSFLTVILPAVGRDHKDFQHEAETVLNDLLNVGDWAVAQTLPGKVLCGTNRFEVEARLVDGALSRLADRYRVPAIFWAYGDLRVAEAHDAISQITGENYG